MQLSELYLNRYLYRENNQSSETKDSVFNSLDNSDTEPASIPSGGAAQDINEGNVIINPEILPDSTLDVSNWGWGQTSAFSSGASSTTVTWGAGVFTSASGDSYTIVPGTTDVMSQKTYIYLSLLDSKTEYQITTTSADSVGLGKVLIAVAKNSTPPDIATFNTTEANQIVADNILANTIDASKMNVSQLSAIAVDAGSITSGIITGALVRTSASGGRVQLNDSTDALEVFDTGGIKRIVLDNNELTFLNVNGFERGGITAGITEVTLSALNGGNLTLNSIGSAYSILFQNAGSSKLGINTSGIVFYDDVNVNAKNMTNIGLMVMRSAGYLDMNGSDLLDVGDIRAKDTTSDIGTSTTPFDNLYISDIYNLNIIHDTVEFAGNLVPEVGGTGAQDIGVLDNMFDQCWVDDFFGVYHAASDKRLKTDIKTLPTALEKLLEMRPVSFKYKPKNYKKVSAKEKKRKPKEVEVEDAKIDKRKLAKSKKVHYGFIAQEMLEIYPSLVSEGESEDKFLSLNYDEVIPILVKAVQELSAEVESLKAKALLI